MSGATNELPIPVSEVASARRGDADGALGRTRSVSATSAAASLFGLAVCTLRAILTARRAKCRRTTRNSYDIATRSTQPLNNGIVRRVSALLGSDLPRDGIGGSE